jgi:hypothetical protein
MCLKIIGVRVYVHQIIKMMVMGIAKENVQMAG